MTSQFQRFEAPRLHEKGREEAGRPWYADGFFWFGLCLAGILLFAHRHTLNADGMSYLEVGASWLEGDISQAINGYWNPVYAILAAMSHRLVPVGRLAPVGPHVLNFFLFIGAYFTFRHLARRLVRTMLPDATNNDRRVLYLVGTPVFLWTAIRVNELVELIPDLLVFILVLLAVAELLNWRDAGSKGALLYGGLLGLGYLTKSVMFPLGLVFLCAGLFTVRPFRRGLGLTALATLSFLAVASLYVIPLSIQKGGLTFGESGRLAYAWEVNRFGPYFHWQGKPEGSGTPVHPTQQILDYPPTYAFDFGAPGTYPLFRDPSYWNEGIRARFDIEDQMKRLAKSAKFYRDTLVREPIVTVLLFSMLIGGAAVGWKPYLQSAGPLLPIAGASLVPFGLYSAVYIDARYLAPFLLLLVMVALVAYLRTRGGASNVELRWAGVTSGFVCVMLFFATAFACAKAMREDRWNSYRTHERIAKALLAAGVREGDKLAVIGRGNESFFAGIMGSQIIAEAIVFPGHREWPATVENVEKICDALRSSTQAAAVVSMVPFIGEQPSGWTAVPGTAGYFRVLRSSP